MIVIGCMLAITVTVSEGATSMALGCVTGCKKEFEPLSSAGIIGQAPVGPAVISNDAW